MPEASKKTEVKNSKELPSVFHMDLPKREEFLSQIGSFTQEQRRIFHRICDFYDPALDYNRFILHAGKDILFANNQIEILMKKLKNAHYGLLKFQLIEGELKPNKIVISNRDSIEFYSGIIEDEMQRNLLDENKSFLVKEELEKQKLTIPFDFIDSIGPELLSPGFIQKNKGLTKIYSIKLKTGASIIIASPCLDSLIIKSKKRIREYLKNSSFISIVSRYMGIKISDIQKSMNSKDSHFWQGLSSKILQNRDDLQLRLKHLEVSLFQSSEILHHYYKNTASEEEIERKDNAARDAAVDDICKLIMKKENFLVTNEELNKMMKPNIKKWDGFKDLFFERAVKFSTKVGLPPVLAINGYYIHRDHIYPYFRSELSLQSRELKSHYIQIMERMLRTGNKDRITTFYTRETFNDDILDMIREESPVLAEFLSKPRIISEAIVHYFKNLKKIRDVGKIKEFMNHFFDKGVIKFKDLDHLLGLYLLDIFEESYSFLSWWKKLILRFSGKKDSLRNQFSGLGERDINKNIVMTPKKDDEFISRSGESLKKNREYNTYSQRKKDSSKTNSSRRRHSTAANISQYNIKQRNKAWIEFEDAFNKKN